MYKRQGRLEPIKAAVSGTVNTGLLEVRAEAEGGCAFGAVHAGLREELKDGRGPGFREKGGRAGHHQAPGRGVQDAASLLEPSSQIPGRERPDF